MQFLKDSVPTVGLFITLQKKGRHESKTFQGLNCWFVSFEVYLCSNNQIFSPAGTAPPLSGFSIIL